MTTHDGGPDHVVVEWRQVPETAVVSEPAASNDILRRQARGHVCIWLKAVWFDLLATELLLAFFYSRRAAVAK